MGMSRVLQGRGGGGGGVVAAADEDGSGGIEGDGCGVMSCSVNETLAWFRRFKRKKQTKNCKI